MSETGTTLENALEGLLRRIVKEEIRAAMGQNGYHSNIPSKPTRSYFTVKEASDFSRLGISTIRLAIRRRQLKANQVGSRVIIKRTDLEQFLEAHTIEITPD